MSDYELNLYGQLDCNICYAHGEIESENIYVSPKGYKFCKICRKISQKKRREKNVIALRNYSKAYYRMKRRENSLNVS